jgi:myo-inositol-1(or 4)-monophosphatase
MRSELGSISADDVRDKSLNNLVSYVDKTAEERLVAGLTDFLPNSQVLAEEGTVVAKSDSVFRWIIDPLDGTTNFVHQLPFFSISIALQRNDELIMGVVYNVMLDELFYAWEGSAAYCNGKEIRVSNTNDLKDSLLATGFPYYQFDKAPQYLAAFAKLMQNSRGIRRLGSAALDLAYTACGRFDAYFEYNLQPWDIAAGAFLVQQAGGQVSDFSNTNAFISGAEVVATNGKLHQPLLTVLQESFGAV